MAKQDGTCRYCGMRQNDGSTSWVLESVASFSGFAYAASEAVEAKPFFAGMQLSRQERESMIQCVIALMLADGVIEPREEVQLIKMAAKHNIPEGRLKELIQQVQKDSDVCLPQVDDWKTRSAFFKGLVQMCLADGHVSGSERKVLQALVAHMGYTDVDIDRMISQERAELYAASKATIKVGKESRSV
jgi:uncharacterized tellurite resistance protein B-like protein